MLPALGHDSHSHDFGELSGCKGTIQTIRDAGHGLEANLFWMLNVSYVKPNDFWSYTPVNVVGVCSITLTVRVTGEGGAYTDASKTITVATTAPIAAMVSTELTIVVVISRRRRTAPRSPALG